MKAIAFYLPQFHPVPENDEWWGKGFTEWRNVAQAKPQFPGHEQPHIPADLGFYDLRVPEVRQAQADLAREYGIYGFCYYHYWFNGRRILERPVDEIVASGKPDFPFCLCWANENWTRRWDGWDNEVLLKQTYSAEDDAAHFRALEPYFEDPRYIRVDGKPMFLVYRASRFPDPAATVARWRAQARRASFQGVYLCNVESTAADTGLAMSAGFDAAVEFAPDWECLTEPIRPLPGLPRFLRARLSDKFWWENDVYEYRVLRERMLAKADPPYIRFPGVTPAWDNSARRKKHAVMLRNSTPDEYEKWLGAVVSRFAPPSKEEDFIFINAWNEWAEGNHLEPCLRWGRKYLEATKRVLGRAPNVAAPEQPGRVRQPDEAPAA